MATHKTLGYYGPAFDIRQAGTVATRYVIVASPRTGSNYICARLANFRDAFGVPMEYLHRDAIAEFGARALGPDHGPAAAPARQVDFAAYLTHLERRRTTRDGYFGLKVQPSQLLAIFNGNVDRAVSFLRKFDRLVVMLRKDKVAQAVSGAIAQDTGRWFNFGEELVVSDEQAAALLPAIAKQLSTYLAEESFVNTMTSRLADKPVLVVHHESLLEDPEAVTRQVVAFLNPKLAALPPEDAKLPLTERPAGRTSARLRADFLRYITNSPAA